MKRIILITIIIPISLSAIELSINLGGNYQQHRDYKYSWSPDQKLVPVDYDGFGFNGGSFINIGFTRPEYPVFIGLETGLGFVRLNYVEQLTVDSIAVIQTGKVTWEQIEPDVINFNSINVPFLFNLAIPAGKDFTWGAGMGPVFLCKLPWEDTYILYGETYEFTHRAVYDLGLKLQTHVAFKLTGRLWLKPAFKVNYNLSADEPGGNREWEQSYAFSIGLSVKL